MASNDVRLVLENVPRVGFYTDMRRAGFDNCPEDMTLPSCLRSILQYLGDTRLGCEHSCGKSDQLITECSYAYLMSVSGRGFSLNWSPGKWDHDIMNPLHITADALGPPRWALQSRGYSCEALGNRALDVKGLFPAHGDEAEFRARIKASIAAGRPVLGYGVVGPPECCIITGYDEGGDVLIGWTFFAEMPEFRQGLEFEPNGYYRKRGWFADTEGIVVLTGKTEPPPLLDTYRETLQRALSLMRSSGVAGYASGIAAYDAWEADLLDDAQYAGADVEAVRPKYGLSNGIVGEIAEYRCYSGRFLDEAARAFPTARDDLLLAAGAYAVEHDLMWRAWEALGGHPEFTRLTEDPAVQFGRPEARRRIVEVIRTAKGREEEAAEHVEKALARIAAEGNTGAAPIVRRAVLEGAPYLGFDGKQTGGRPETTYMCAAMKAALAYIGEPYSYEFLMGTSGAAFRLAWNAERWDGGNISTLHMGGDPTEHYRRAFRAVGWVPWVKGNVEWRQAIGGEATGNIYKGADYIGDNADYEDEAAFRRILEHNVHHKRYPILAIGVVYPPECGLITGYDEGGDVVIGRSHFQDWPENVQSGKVTFEADGRYRKRDWFADTVAFITFGYKTSRPTPVDTYPEALKWAVKLARTPRFGQHHSGLAAYGAWAEAMRGDSDFAGADEDGLFVRLMCHNDAISCLGEGRRYAAAFLRSAAAMLPDAAASLQAAASFYEAEVGTIEAIMASLGGMGWSPAAAHELAKPEARRRIVPLIEKARAEDEAAVSQIEAALQG